MKIAYAFRRSVYYPYHGNPRLLPDKKILPSFFSKIRKIGFEGIELSIDMLGGLGATEKSVGKMRLELEQYGVPCIAVRGGGGFSQPNVSSQNRKLLEKTIEVAHWIGAETVNTTMSTLPRNSNKSGSFVGESISQGSSRMASSDDFNRTGDVLSEIGEIAGNKDVYITIEVHQHSIVDNSWSALHLLELIDSPNIFLNPDLGNIYWCYDIPEESTEDAIVALAPHSRYWHCKNLKRVYIPENEHSIFLRTALPDGDIDYRFAITAMKEAGFNDYLAIEGAMEGDQLTADSKSYDYVTQILNELDISQN